jgi:hypothetical protein
LDNLFLGSPLEEAFRVMVLEAFEVSEGSEAQRIGWQAFEASGGSEAQRVGWQAFEVSEE